MKQIIQDLKNGNTLLEDVPAPLLRKGHVLIKTRVSLVSLGTEKMLVEFGKGNLLAKARQQPDKVKQVLEKIQTDGLFPTLEAVFNKLDEPLPLGYCNAGEVLAVGDGVTEFKVGDRVASNGQHAEVVCIPKNLCAKIPDEVSYEEAAFTVIGAIGLEGIRLANPTMGETVVVIGLGLIGLITAELLVANGCKVIGFDVDDAKIKIARSKNIDAFNASTVNVVKTTEQLTNEVGADAVIITASAKNNDIIHQAAEMSRKRGRIILVGVIGLDLQRADFYKKELSFQVSCSYGPGRYDENYEQRGIDYPLPYVRWTQKRNFETILDAIAKKRLNVNDLITEKIQLEDYQQIYNSIGSGSIASLLIYPENSRQDLLSSVISSTTQSFQSSKGIIGIIGAGNFTKMTLLPALKKSNPQLKYISSAGGLTAKALANKYSFANSTSDYKEILKDEAVDLVMITTRHDLHAKMVIESIKAGKHVFVEKPLAIYSEELDAIIQTYQEQLANGNGKSLTVGFNRRFSPFVQKAKQLLGQGKIPMNIVATMNAGYISQEVWVQNRETGGGRIIGEACHYIDLMIALTGSKVTAVMMSALGTQPDETTDNAIITLQFESGAQGVINYFSNGNKAYAKERVEIYAQGKTLILDNFRKLQGFGFKGFKTLSTAQDKGHSNQFGKLLEMVKNGGNPLIPFDEIVNTTRASFAALESLTSGKWIKI